MLVLSGCRIHAVFDCDLDEQCRRGEIAGTCQLAEGFCSFPDDTCGSLQRFADNAGDGLAGMCVDAVLVDGGVDAIDAAPFDTSVCPQTYNRTIASKPASRYRVITSTANVWTQAATCKADLAGATHLVVLDDAMEMDELRAILSPIPIPIPAFVGVVQDPAATMPAQGWVHFDGRLAIDLWSSPDPDNNGTPETERRANVADMDSVRDGIHDTLGTQREGAICECDGNPVHPMAQAYLDGDPSKP